MNVEGSSALRRLVSRTPLGSGVEVTPDLQLQGEILLVSE
jgi:hypothetical protein